MSDNFSIGREICCELCTANILKGTIFRVDAIMYNPVTICERCRDAILAAQPEYWDGTKP